jgi:hypothetical protein
VRESSTLTIEFGQTISPETLDSDSIGFAMR